MSEQINTDPSQGFDTPFNYALGTGWYSMIPDLLNSITQGRAARATTGLGVLGELGKFLTSPTAGPLGLAAAASYGGPQGIAAGTNGAGIDNSAQMSRYDKMLNDLMGYAGKVNVTGNDIPTIDPNKAPAPTPEAAAQAPNATADMFSRWNTYSPEEQARLKAIAGTGLPGGKSPEVPATPGPFSNFKEGGEVQLPHPIDKMVEKSGKVHKAVKAMADVAHMHDAEVPVPAPGRAIPRLADGGLAQLNDVAQGLGSDADKMRFWDTMRKLNFLNQRLANIGKTGSGEPYDFVSNIIGPDKYNGVLPEDAATIASGPGGAETVRRLLTYAKRNPNNPDDVYFNFADGGGVTLAGQPHWIVDDRGAPVAAITEDGAPENVRGLANGGVEVTPLRPDRFKKYTGDSAGGAVWGKMLAELEPEKPVPGAAAGAQLYPDYPGGKVDTNPGEGTNEIPTQGGPTPSTPTGTDFGGYGPDARTTPGSIEDLFNMTNNVPGQNYFQKFARMLGGALHSNTTTGDLASSLNQGKAPTNLASSQQLSTMSPYLRQNYAALLQQMGIVNSPQDLDYAVKQFTPAGLG